MPSTVGEAIAALLPGWTTISMGGADAKISLIEYSTEQRGHCTTASGQAPSGTITGCWHFGQLEINAINSTPLRPEVNARSPPAGSRPQDGWSGGLAL